MLVGEWEYVLVCRMTPLSRPGCPFGPYMSRFRNFILGSCFIFIPGRPAGPPVARSATNPWAPRLENGKGVGPPELSPQPRGFGRNLFPAKALASAAKPDRAGGRARGGGGLVGHGMVSRAVRVLTFKGVYGGECGIGDAPGSSVPSSQ